MRQKCAKCGFINFPNDSTCKRCKSALGQPLEFHNVWRDGKNLVVSKSEHKMPERCLKCGTTDYVDRYVLELTHTPITAYLAIIFSIFTHWTSIELYGFLCGPHRGFAQRQTFLLLPNILAGAGAVSVLLSLPGDDPGLRGLLFFGGGIMLAVGVLFIKLSSGTLKVVKNNKKHIWIKGVDQNLLAQLEDFAVVKR